MGCAEESGIFCFFVFKIVNCIVLDDLELMLWMSEFYIGVAGEPAGIT